MPQEKISLENLQAALENDLHIKDKQTLSFITLCLVEPVWLPGGLSALVCSLLSSTSYFCTNQNPSTSLKAVAENNQIVFHLNLHIKTLDDEKILPRGTATIRFTFDNITQVKLLPINMKFIFPNEEEAEQFQQKLTEEFKGWLLLPNELNNIQIKLQQRHNVNMDVWVISSLFGLLIGLIAMISFITFSLSFISVLILPPIGLALGLCLASCMHTYLHMNTKKEQEKLKRPIRLFNGNPSINHHSRPTTSFFVHPSPDHSRVSEISFKHH
ncbi:hypothetical protein [Rickettsiella endosymbiont of Aleochara curtula]|uniref:hypothetical protein n=1 Tax=Rickettsiella endosymbiont of Aleochara curtula TaxID=3077936 RepID=UPI00313B95B7